MLGSRDQPALVLLHGFGAASGHWRHNAAALAEAGWCVYAIDLVGFGASSQPAHRRHRPLDNRLWARQVQGFLEQVVQGPAVLVGNSLGSLVAVTCAVFFPQWVLAVVAAPLPDPTLLMPMGRRRRPWRRRLQRRLVVVLCRLLPLELLVPLIARTPLLDLGLRSAYSDQRAVDRELRMGALNNVSFTVGNIPWKIFRVNAVYVAAFGRLGESLPSADIAALTNELDRKK